MASLAQLLASHDRILVLDAASNRVQTGLLRATDAVWDATGAEAGTGIFSGADAVLERTGLGIDAIDAFVYCDGPGSMLGIRTVAMALRTWIALRTRPVYAYRSLALAASGEHHRAPRACHVIADARRNAWHCQSVSAEGILAPLQRLDATVLPTGELLTPENFRAWAGFPATVTTCPYDLAAILPRIASRDLFQPVAAPDAHLHEAPEYKRWNARVHSAETTGPR